MGFNPWVPNRRQGAGYMAMIAENGNFGDMFWSSNARNRNHTLGDEPGAEPDTWSVENHAGSDVGDVDGLKREIKQEEWEEKVEKQIEKEEVKIEVKKEEEDDEDKQWEVVVKREETDMGMDEDKDKDEDDMAVKIKIKTEAEEEEEEAEQG
ncbi:hypothetical protein AYO20_03650 [Fonsecaea nubica]|uniref:Uncharacterized protein n=1 Tax=Fonsecaea nubica TaxID=856822 RepID=A0A178D6G1_9EURO|nr:hypothetical protein AYO20_03650 [Fonsecaea nubica]OAL37172.1 hypothetical protein AYO20_03650 [Fonsecaea nubica]